MFYKNYLQSRNIENQKLKESFKVSNKTNEDFWRDVPDLSSLEYKYYDFCLFLLETEYNLVRFYNNFVRRLSNKLLIK